MTDDKNAFASARPTVKLDLESDGVLIEEDFQKKMAIAIAEITEQERESQREQLGTQPSLLGGDSDVADMLPWDTFLMTPSAVRKCAEQAGVRPYAILKFAYTNCKPTNYMALFWMHAWMDQLWRQPVAINSEEAFSEEAIEEVLRLREAGAASLRGHRAAELRHSKPGGSRDKQAAIRAAWASGIYKDRDLCASQEYEAIGFGGWGTARRALRNTPDPDPWPGKRPSVT